MVYESGRMSYEYLLGVGLITFCLVYLTVKAQKDYLRISFFLVSLYFMNMLLMLTMTVVPTYLHNLIGVIMLAIYAIMFLVVGSYLLNLILTAFQPKKDWWENEEKYF